MSCVSQSLDDISDRVYTAHCVTVYSLLCYSTIFHRSVEIFIRRVYIYILVPIENLFVLIILLHTFLQRRNNYVCNRCRINNNQQGTVISVPA